MKQELSVLGIDIAKRVFHAVGMDEKGMLVLRKRLSRHDLRPCSAQLPPVLIGMEACGGAHDWARRFREHGTKSSSWRPHALNPMSSRTKTTRTTPKALAKR
jgi:transposase